MISKGIKNIIFDVGGVIINLDLDKTFSQFALASGKTTEELKKAYFNAQLWQKHEIGQASDAELRDEMRRNFFPHYTDNQIDEVWNALLLDIPLERVQLLLKLKTDYKIFLLSNTNEIHRKRFNQILKETSGINDFKDIFHQVYYSHQMGLRKPNPEIYKVVLNEQKIRPEETLFLDDNAENLASAKQLGIATELITSKNSILEVFSA